MRTSSKLIAAGRDPERFEGVVNTPVVRGSTLLSPNMAHWQKQNARQQADEPGVSVYGRFGTATHHALQDAITELSGGYRSLLYPSGLAAISSVLTALLSSGDHILLTNTAYSPTGQFLNRTLARFGVQVSHYDANLNENIKDLIQANTRVVYVESPGSYAFNIQDIPAISKVAHAHGAFVVMDNTWATPLYFDAFSHGVDVSIQAATKYIVGHSDALLGVATCNEKTWSRVRDTSQDFGQTCSPDDAYLALRGLRTMGVRLKQHWASSASVAQWLETRPEVAQVRHPALPSHPQHALWKRDFKGACGLFSFTLHPIPQEALHAFIDALKMFGLGLSWGGYESLIMPTPEHAVGTLGQAVTQRIRIHVGLEDPLDLIDDLTTGFEAMSQVYAECTA